MTAPRKLPSWFSTGPPGKVREREQLERELEQLRGLIDRGRVKGSAHREALGAMRALEWVLCVPRARRVALDLKARTKASKGGA